MHARSVMVLALCAAAAATGAAQAADFDDSARVIAVTPQVEQFNHPRQECQTSYIQEQRQPSRNVGGSILGGLAGGLLGSQVGGGNGRTVAAAAGAITGAIVGDRMENRDGYVVERPVQQCRQVDHWESRNNGYAVTYEYHGRNYTTVMPYDPGERVRLHVSLSPRV